MHCSADPKVSSNLEFDSSNKNSLISDGESLLQCFASIDMKVVLFVRASIIFFWVDFPLNTASLRRQNPSALEL